MFLTSHYGHTMSFKINMSLPASIRYCIVKFQGFDVRTILTSPSSILNSNKLKLSFRGSLSIEAACIMPFCILCFLSLMFFIRIIGFQQTIQIQLEETARKINSTAYITQDNINITNGSSILSPMIVSSLFFTEDIKNLCKEMHIKNGNLGLFFLHSTINTDTQIADIVVTYTINIPFLPNKFFCIPFAQRCNFKLFTGYNTQQSSMPKETTVYMTANGSVYHTNKYCTYLVRYADIISLSYLYEYEKKTGKFFSACNACKKNYNSTENMSIYISSTGNSYHFSRDCYYLTAHIFQCNINQVADYYPPCSRCSE